VEVKRPDFSSNIYINDTLKDTEIERIDVSKTHDNPKYDNKTLTFTTSNSSKWEIDHEYYITFDEGVLFSDTTSKSSARKDSKFWRIKVVADDQSSTEPMMASTTESPNSDTTTTSKPSTTVGTLVTQLGMGLGITFILILIIAEIVYFNYFYHGTQRSGNHQS
jgi:hypothetical protein